jgi:gamma-glutamylcyclotransferase
VGVDGGVEWTRGLRRLAAFLSKLLSRNRTVMSFHCFAYGSNMFTRKMRVPAASAKAVAIGHLPGHRLVFNKVSRDDGSGKGNIVATGDTADKVWGVVFEIADSDRAKLDGSEGGYERVEVEIRSAAGAQRVVTYIAKAGRTDDTLQPYTWYKEFVFRGAAEHGLPADYVRALDAVPAIDDPDPARERRNRDVLGR